MPAKSKKTGNATPNASKFSFGGTEPAQPDSGLPPPNIETTMHAVSQRASAQTNGKYNQVNNMADNMTDNSASQPAVNRKKQKRREKEAAKRASEQQAESERMARSGYLPNPRSLARSYFREETGDFNNYSFGDDVGDGDETFFSGAEDPLSQGQFLRNGFDQTVPTAGGSTGKKKKKAKNLGRIPTFPHNHSGNSSLGYGNADPLSEPQLPPTPSLSAAALRSAHENFAQDQIWNTSTQAERENIKQFWLELGEEERRSLVKVEKEAVLRKMKEQQKHSCSCTVCGRKRTAIEEELEVLYDAYYEELEQFANHNNHLPNGAAIMSDPRSYAHFRTRRHPMAGQYPVERTRHHLIDGEEGLDDDDYDEDEEPYSDDEAGEVPTGAPDFFTFGNSLTVKDGILTVADDLLKNDGRNFIDMMESLAEKRMQRHNHPSLDEEDDYEEEEDDEDYDSQEDDDLEADEMSAMTEEQRMEEGRRMFQIFAARMFEQRVLTAYREKVARERQQKFIEELDEENRLDTQKEAKKAREAARKKEKKKMQKQAKDEEKAKKEAEKAAQEAAVREAEEKRLEEQRQRKEEQRKRREAERKAADDERRRKEAERQRKAQEERERQQEMERKQRDIKDRERRKREEARKQEREEKAVKERELRERKTREEAERKTAEEQAKRAKEGVMKAGKEAKERLRQDEQPRQGTKRTPITIPPGIHPPHLSAVQSPQFQVATPMLPPKSPTPARPRQHSQQGSPSYVSSPRSQQAAATATSLSSTPSSTSVAPPNASAPINIVPKQHGQIPLLHHPQPAVPLSPLSSQSRPPYSYNGMPGPATVGPAPTSLGMMPNMLPQQPMYHRPPMGAPHRAYGLPNGIPFPPGMNGNRQPAQTSYAQFQPQPSAAPAVPVAPQRQSAMSQSHSRQPSMSHERGADGVTQPTPISRPVPIVQSAHSTPDKKEQRESSDPEVEQLALHLGSKALLDDSDIPLTAGNSDHLFAPGAPGSGRAPFGHFTDPKHDAFQPGNWGAFSPDGPLTETSKWTTPGITTKHGGWTTSHHGVANAFGAIGAGAHAPHRPHASRPVAIRIMVAEACSQLSATPGTSSDGFHPASFLLRQVEQMKPLHEPAISLNEMLEICDTEGNAQNGGGNFVLRNDGFQGQKIKFEIFEGNDSRRSVGDIGSPISTHPQLATFGGIGQPVSGAHEGR